MTERDYFFSVLFFLCLTAFVILVVGLFLGLVYYLFADVFPLWQYTLLRVR